MKDLYRYILYKTSTYLFFRENTQRKSPKNEYNA